MDNGELLASGRDADVWLLPDGWVLRRYRDTVQQVEREAAYLRWVARHGYPVPEVRRAEGVELEMRRLTGRTLLGELVAGSLTAAEVGTRLGLLLRTLHAVPALDPHAPGAHRVRHGDLHPDNVLATPSGDVVIDWTTADDGPPGFDTAHSAVIIAQTLDQPDVHGVSTDGVLALLTALLQAADGFDEDDLAAAVRRRTANPTLLPRETAAVPAAATLVRRLAGGA